MTDTRFHDAMNWSTLPESRNGWGNRYFIDTEFSDFHAPEVLSIAIVGENGVEFYGGTSAGDPYSRRGYQMSSNPTEFKGPRFLWGAASF